MSDRKGFLAVLPDELLHKIIKLATSSPSAAPFISNSPLGNKCPCREMETPNGMKQSLALVCQRFNRIVTPFLYEDPFGTEWPHRSPELVPPAIKVMRLHRTLQCNLTLRQHCRILRLDFSDMSVDPNPSADNFIIVNDIVSWLSEVRCITIHGGFKAYNKEIWSLITNISSSMGSIKHISLSRSACSLLLPDVARNVDMPSLESLLLWGLSASGRGGSIMHPDVCLY
jgi:hypothetical protein